MMEAWTLEDGLKLVRLLQPETRKYGYHLALGGSVLNTGKSDKDIDLYFMPLENTREPQADLYKLTDWLQSLWGNYEIIGKEYEGEPLTPMGLGAVAEQQEARPARPGWQRNVYYEPPQRRAYDLDRDYRTNTTTPGTPFRVYEPQEVDFGTTTISRADDQKEASGPKSVYKRKLKFLRPDGRIDVFIM